MNLRHFGTAVLSPSHGFHALESTCLPISSSLRPNPSSRGRGRSRIFPTPPRTTHAPCWSSALKMLWRQMLKRMVGFKHFLVSYGWMRGVVSCFPETRRSLSPRSTRVFVHPQIPLLKFFYTPTLADFRPSSFPTPFRRPDTDRLWDPRQR